MAPNIWVEALEYNKQEAMLMAANLNSREEMEIKLKVETQQLKPQLFI